MDNKINYEHLLKNIDSVIFQLEYDGMRSGGKVKMNVADLNELYIAKERYSKMVVKPKAPKKEG